jgi:hypothetical protein
MVVCPFNPNRSSPCPPAYPLKQPVFIRPTPAPAQNNQPSAPRTRFPAIPSSSKAASTVGSLDTSSKTVPIQSRINLIFNKLLGARLKAREMWPTLQRAKIQGKLGVGHLFSNATDQEQGNTIVNG